MHSSIFEAGPKAPPPETVDVPDVIPIFPLPKVVLLPSEVLPLHIFEPRYVDMVRDALASHRVIGMVDVLRGFFEQNDNLVLRGIEDIGFVAEGAISGGDYFDYVDGPGGVLRLVVGDVSGHGVPAALLMTTARALLRALSPGEEDMATLVRRVNEHLERDLDPGKFMTLFYGDLYLAEGTMRYVRAGHNEPLHYLADEDRFVKDHLAHGDGDEVLAASLA